MKSKPVALGDAFPHEGFVQRSIEAYFTDLGFEIDNGTDADLICHLPATGEKWIIEAKGKTSAIGLDFRTGLGQLIQRMQDAETQYGLAVPTIPQFVAQCSQARTWVRKQLRLHCLFVDGRGQVREVGTDSDFSAHGESGTPCID